MCHTRMQRHRAVDLAGSFTRLFMVFENELGRPVELLTRGAAGTTTEAVQELADVYIQARHAWIYHVDLSVAAVQVIHR